jgi:hypothetical protein
MSTGLEAGLYINVQCSGPLFRGRATTFSEVSRREAENEGLGDLGRYTSQLT